MTRCGRIDEQFQRLHRRLDTLERHAVDLMFLQIASQDLLLGTRRNFSGLSQAAILRAVAAEPYRGQCPCSPGRAGRWPGAEFDHFFHRSLNKAEHGWLICAACHDDLPHGGYLLHFSRMPRFRAFQALVLAQRRRGRMHMRLGSTAE